MTDRASRVFTCNPRPAGLGIALCLGVLLSAEASLAEPHAKAGLGTGLAYGSPIFGAGVELEITYHISALGGVGALSDGTPWALGARVYLHPPTSRWRLHGSAFRWSEGTGFYIGADHDVGKSSGVVLMYGVGFGDVNLEAPVGLTFGIGYRF